MHVVLVLGETPLGAGVLAADDTQAFLDQILAIISDGGFPPAGRRAQRRAVESDFGRDTAMKRCKFCARMLDDSVDADEIFQMVSGWTSDGEGGPGLVELEEATTERRDVYAYAGCLWRELTGGSATVPDTPDDGWRRVL